MVGSLIPLDSGKVAAAFGGRSSGMLDAARAGVQASFAVVGYKGRNWRLKHRGEEQLLRDPQGRPMPELDVVIVGVAPSISKIYYEKSYVEGDDSAPDCFSLDGIAPDAAAPRKQNATCGNCPKNAWGSRITEAGKRAKACQDSRRIALVPLGDIANETLGGPMLLRIPPTSLPNLANYADFLLRKGADLPWVGTRLSFDYDVAYPKIEFTALGYLDEDQANQVMEQCQNPAIERMLTDAGPTGSEQGPAADADIPGTPPAAMQQPSATVTRLPRKTQQAAPPPPPQEPATTSSPAPANPFAAAIAPPKPAAPQAAPKRRTASATQPVAAAPADLESAIDDLLADQPA